MVLGVPGAQFLVGEIWAVRICFSGQGRTRTNSKHICLGEAEYMKQSRWMPSFYIVNPRFGVLNEVPF